MYYQTKLFFEKYYIIFWQMRFWQMQRKADVHFWSLDAAIKVLFKSATCNSSSKVYIPHLYELIIALPVFLKHQSLLEKSRLNTEKTALIMGQHTTPRWPEIRPLKWFLARLYSQFSATAPKRKRDQSECSEKSPLRNTQN